MSVGAPTQPAQADGDPWYIFGVTPHREHEPCFTAPTGGNKLGNLFGWTCLPVIRRWFCPRPSRVGMRTIPNAASCQTVRGSFTRPSNLDGWLACVPWTQVKPIALTPPGLVAGDIVTSTNPPFPPFLGANQPSLPLHQQLFEVQLDGSGLNCLTPEPGHHVISHAPLGTAFVATHQSVEMAPEIRLHASDDVVHILHPRSSFDARVRSATSKLVSTMVGETEVFGVLHLPATRGESPFPLLVDVYGGPHSRGFDPRFNPVRAENLLGVATLKIASRGTTGQSKAFQDDVYGKLGQVDLGDQAALAAAVSQLVDVDAERVGIYGFSYGGYMSALGLIKHPDVFRFGVSGAPVVDWRYYDTIYTERYMGLLPDNEYGYDAGSCLTSVSEAGIGKMLLLHGAVDDNVHVANAFALMDRLHQEQHPFDSMIYPNVGHGLTRMALAGCGTFFWGTVSHKNPFFLGFSRKGLAGGRFHRYFSTTESRSTDRSPIALLSPT